MKLYNPFKTLSKFEWYLWSFSLFLIILSFILCRKVEVETLAALLVGATALIFVSKGHPFGQLLTLLFSCLYAYISLKFRYYGEMITYLGMTAPMALAALITWIRHPAKKGAAEVKVRPIKKQEALLLLLSTLLVTAIFYYILKYFNTPNLFWSTVSIATSFSASALTYLRSPYYALAYSANDIVLIILWILATVADITYLPMIVCFIIFLINDLYGYYNWKKINRRQQKEKL